MRAKAAQIRYGEMVMNRRESLKTLLAGIPIASLQVVDPPTMDPAKEMFVLRSDGFLTQQMIARIQEHWKDLTKGTPFEQCKLLVLDKGLMLERHRLR